MEVLSMAKTYVRPTGAVWVPKEGMQHILHTPPVSTSQMMLEGELLYKKMFGSKKESAEKNK